MCTLEALHSAHTGRPPGSDPGSPTLLPGFQSCTPHLQLPATHRTVAASLVVDAPNQPSWHMQRALTTARGAQAAATASRCTSCCATRPTRASWTPHRRARPRRAWPRSPAACGGCRRAPRPRCWPACTSWPPRPRTRRRRRRPCRRALRSAHAAICVGLHHAQARHTSSSMCPLPQQQGYPRAPNAGGTHCARRPCSPSQMQARQPRRLRPRLRRARAPPAPLAPRAARWGRGRCGHPYLPRGKSMVGMPCNTMH